MLKYKGQIEGKTMNEAGTVAYSCAETVPSSRLQPLYRTEFEDSRAMLGESIRLGEATLPQILAHRALTDYWHGRLDRSALMNRLAHIEARS
jgi:hypothetical protein